MYGDSDTIERHADLLRARAVDLQAWADRLVARTDALPWGGRAADAMRARVGERATHLRSAAGRHEGAADALRAHGTAVDQVKEEIARVELRAMSLISDARTRLARVAAANEAGGPAITPDPDDVALDTFTPPPRGHRDWLDVTLPGL